MNTLDYILISIGLIGSFIGYRRGLLIQLVSILGFFAAYVAAFVFYDDVSPWLQNVFPVEALPSYQNMEFALKGLKLERYLYNTVAFALLFFTVKIALTFAGRTLNLITKVPGLNAVNQWSGAMLAILEVILLAIIAVNVMKMLPSESVNRLLEQSRTAQWLFDTTPILADKLRQLWITV
ncbi:hypothetical protein SY83_07685 [Paenibacillus swuensis]|uniref:CvpA family protein n=1 Tax=Paenibacillus swuensis TaxID=1178515 RepID=A0A172TGN4_9BACL|nr:CvpA family protein [Paenibacillus swuensis]ANE46170.1 hypothetical protein SY83_07685 [Paenibacillus swuensis]